MNKQPLDKAIVQRGLLSTRTKANDAIKRGLVIVQKTVITNPRFMVADNEAVKLSSTTEFVSRAGEKLFSVVDALHLDFRDRVVLDVGASTGGFTEVALRGGASKVIAVEIGTQQLHPRLQGDERIELHEKTDILDFQPSESLDMIVVDVSFISVRAILPALAQFAGPTTEIVVMVKPQFEVKNTDLQHQGVIKNERLRRDVLKVFEQWASQLFRIEAKADSGVRGAKGNLERFYKLRKLR